MFHQCVLPRLEIEETAFFQSRDCELTARIEYLIFNIFILLESTSQKIYYTLIFQCTIYYAHILIMKYEFR